MAGCAFRLTAAALGSLAWPATVNSISGLTLLQQSSGGAATSLLYLVPPVIAGPRGDH